jgi:hypothetical protein
MFMNAGNAEVRRASSPPSKVGLPLRPSSIPCCAKRAITATEVGPPCWPFLFPTPIGGESVDRSAPVDEDPIDLPDGHKLVTLRDAATYITKLPKREHNAPEWQAAMEALLIVAEQGGPTMFARIGVMLALNRHVVPMFESSGKKTHWGKRKLVRDRF